MLGGATRLAVDRLVAEFALVQMQVKIDPGRTLRVVRRDQWGDWKDTRRFRMDQNELHVLVSLPAEADRNEFRLMIARKDGEAPAVEEMFTWSRQQRERAFTYKPSELAGDAPGKFEVRLYVRGAEPIKRTFRIR